MWKTGKSVLNRGNSMCGVREVNESLCTTGGLDSLRPIRLWEVNGSLFWRRSWKFLRGSGPFSQEKARSTYEMLYIILGGSQVPSEAHPWSGAERTTGQEPCCFHSHLDSHLETVLATLSCTCRLLLTHLKSLPLGKFPGFISHQCNYCLKEVTVYKLTLMDDPGHFIFSPHGRTK